ncbi:MAG: hypothetical protein QXH03_00090 [Candidatus Bathyarchaeia archaeon]
MKVLISFLFASGIAITLFHFLSSLHDFFRKALTPSWLRLMEKRVQISPSFSPLSSRIPWKTLRFPAAFLGYITMAFITSSPFLGILGLSAFFLPQRIESYLKRRRERKIARELDEFFFHLRSLLSFGAGLRPALEEIVSFLPKGTVKERLSLHLSSTFTGEEVLENLARDLESPLLEKLLEMIRVAREGGVNPEEAVKKVAYELREERLGKIEYQIKSGSISLLLPVLLIFLPPIFILGFFPLVNKMMEMLASMR